MESSVHFGATFGAPAASVSPSSFPNRLRRRPDEHGWLGVRCGKELPALSQSGGEFNSNAAPQVGSRAGELRKLQLWHAEQSGALIRDDRGTTDGRRVQERHLADVLAGQTPTVITALETAAAVGLSLKPKRPDEPSMTTPPNPLAPRAHNFDRMVEDWLPLTYVLNNLNRGLGLSDSYPFVLSPPVVEKLRFIHGTIYATG